MPFNTFNSISFHFIKIHFQCILTLAKLSGFVVTVKGLGPFNFGEVDCLSDVLISKIKTQTN